MNPESVPELAFLFLEIEVSASLPIAWITSSD